MSAHTKDLTGLRQQIMDNVEVASSIVHTNSGYKPEFKIITIRRAGQYSSVYYSARVVYFHRENPNTKVFFEGRETEDVLSAYESLLEATSEVIAELVHADEGLEEDGSLMVLDCGGFYDAQAGMS